MSYLGHSVSYQYNESGQLQRVDATDGSWEYAYNAAGLKERVVNETENIVELYEYDAIGRLEKLTHQRSDNGEIIFEADYLLGTDGNRLGIIETRGTDIINWRYEYDALGRLTREIRHAGDNTTPPVRDVSYTYDEDSNRTSLTDHLNANESIVYTCYAGSQKLERETYGDGRYTVYTWNANGQQESKKEYASDDSLSKEHLFVWGPEETMISAQIDDGDGDFETTVSYEYDHTNTLIARTITTDDLPEPVTERYLVDNENLTGYSQTLAELDGEGAVRKIYSYGEQLRSESTREAGGSTSQHFVADGLGSTRALVENGLVAPVNYTAFGDLLDSQSRTSAQQTAYHFTGQRRDATTSLQYHRARWLDTGLSRWGSQDKLFDFPLNQGGSMSMSVTIQLLTLILLEPSLYSKLPWCWHSN